jgi:hypothetical protein
VGGNPRAFRVFFSATSVNTIILCFARPSERHIKMLDTDHPCEVVGASIFDKHPVTQEIADGQWGERLGTFKRLNRMVIDSRSVNLSIYSSILPL